MSSCRGPQAPGVRLKRGGVDIGPGQQICPILGTLVEFRLDDRESVQTCVAQPIFGELLIRAALVLLAHRSRVPGKALQRL